MGFPFAIDQISSRLTSLLNSSLRADGASENYDDDD